MNNIQTILLFIALVLIAVSLKHYLGIDAFMLVVILFLVVQLGATAAIVERTANPGWVVKTLGKSPAKNLPLNG